MSCRWFSKHRDCDTTTTFLRGNPSDPRSVGQGDGRTNNNSKDIDNSITFAYNRAGGREEFVPGTFLQG